MPKRSSNKAGKPKLDPYCPDDFPNIKLKEDKKEDLKREAATPQRKEIPAKKKTKQSEKENIIEDVDDDMVEPSMVKNLSKGFKKTLAMKQKKIETLVEQCEEARGKTDKCLETQAEAQSNLTLEYKKQLGSILKQWEADLQQAQEKEEGINKQLEEEQKKLVQIREAQTKWFQSLKKLHEHYIDSCTENADKFEKSYDTAKQEMAKNLKDAQKNLIAETKHHEVANFRKSVETMMFG